MRLSLARHDLSRTDLTNRLPAVPEDELALERAQRAQHVIRVMMRGSPLAGRVPIFQNSDAVVFDDHLVLVTIGDDGIARWVTKLIEFRVGEIAHGCSLRMLTHVVQAVPLLMTTRCRQARSCRSRLLSRAAPG